MANVEPHPITRTDRITVDVCHECGEQAVWQNGQWRHLAVIQASDPMLVHPADVDDQV